MKGSKIAHQAAPHIKKIYGVRRSRSIWLSFIATSLGDSYAIK